MTKTSSNRCSRLVGLLVAFALLAAAVAPAAAVSVASADVPETGEVGTQVTATVTLEQLYQDPTYEQWQLAGSTGLANATWTVTWYDQTGAKVNQQSYDGANFSGAVVSASKNHARVEVKVTGTVPTVENFTYQPQQSFEVITLRQERSGGVSNEILSRNATHYTAESREARRALDQAAAAIEQAGNPSKAEQTFQNAVSAYNAENFDNAIDLANQAEQQATQSQNVEQRNRLLLYAGAGVLGIGALIGGVWYWHSQRDTYDKLG